eukprot:COSAG05_NODE_108_length_18693_cov_7.956709_13_plen_216_part_00
MAGKCACVAPWSGSRCGELEFATASPAAGRDLYNSSDLEHNTWNGPIVRSGADYHMYLPLYQKGTLYHPVALLYGSAPSMYGPWTWENLTGGDLPTVVDVNPGALVFNDTGGTAVYSLWTAGAIYVAAAPAGPFRLVKGSNNSGCKVNASPLFHAGAFFCIGQKGATIMTATALGGPYSVYSKPDKPHGAEGELIHSAYLPTYLVSSRPCMRLGV